MVASGGVPPPGADSQAEFLRNLFLALPQLTDEVKQQYDRVRDQEEQRKKNR
jgi:hypothetical protein